MKPFLKWAGGKRWLFAKDNLPIPQTFNRYIEPFLGSGAGFFALRPDEAFLSDINPELVNTYLQIRDHPKAISAGLKFMQTEHSKEHYYSVRARPFTADIDGAVRTLYLNRTCWNGLYRLNMKGKFNVPIGTKNAIFSPDEDFLAVSLALKKAVVKVADFEETISLARIGDLIFVDPPYTVKHNQNGFVKYNEHLFSWDDQVRLRDSICKAIRIGATVCLTNADHPSIHDLYHGIGSIQAMSRASVISGKSKGRSIISEALLIA